MARQCLRRALRDTHSLAHWQYYDPCNCVPQAPSPVDELVNGAVSLLQWTRARSEVVSTSNQLEGCHAYVETT